MSEMYGFELVRSAEIGEINTVARLYRHIKTGAELLSLENDDENKVFGITFTTPPPDSTGLSHIMEHSVLCGSRKYPVKEPFVELLKGSLQTFLNAMTFSDKTVYPVASTNLQDFYNLVDVYLDAVFYPRITPQVLQQEGWHYELEALDQPLRFKGVVFNEMKGAYSDPDNVLGRYIEQSLFPDTPYGFDSGGDPAIIPDLTYEQFKDFHDRYYHPSNARIFFYGDDDPAERMRLLDAYLSDFDALQVDAGLPLQPAFNAPQALTYHYAVDAAEDGQDHTARFTVNWALNDVLDTETTLGMEILNHILIGTPASPLRKALIDSGLGEDLAGSGLDPDVRQIYFSTGLKGVRPEQMQDVETLIVDVLRDLAENGIDRATIEASMNTVEFLLREQNTGSYPRGLFQMLNALRGWLHGGDPFEPLAFEAPLDAIKAKVAVGGYFERLLRDYFLDNPHRTSLLLMPDPSLAERQQQAEEARLAAARAAMNEDDLRRVIADTQALRAAQETPDTPEALATIPSLKLEDLPRENKPIPLSVSEVQGVPVLFHDLFTNGIVYFDLGMDLHGLPQHYLPYVRLFGRALLEMGTQTEDYVRLSQRIGQATGGIAPDLYTSTVRGSEVSATWLVLRGKAMLHQAGELFDILRDVLLDVNLDNQSRFKQIVLEEKAAREARLIPGGHVVVLNRLRAHFSEADWVTEQLSGVAYLFFLRQLAERLESDWPAVRAELEDVRRLLVNRQALLANVTLDDAHYPAVQSHLEGLLAAVPDRPFEGQQWTPDLAAADEGLTIPAQVNYVAKGMRLRDVGAEVRGSDLVVTNYLHSTWLWEKVRVQGGAYGGFAVLDRFSSVFAYLSYRDPNLLETLEVYDRTAQFLHTLELSPDELTKAIIGLIGDLDTYRLPDAKGYVSMKRYLAGDTDEARQQLRDEVLATTAEDFRRYGDVLGHVSEQGRVVVLGSRAAIEAANRERAQQFSIVRVM